MTSAGVEVFFQQYGGCVRVGSARHLLSSHSVLRLETGQAFILIRDGHSGTFRELITKGPRQLGARTFSSIHVDREPDDNGVRAVFLHRIDYGGEQTLPARNVQRRDRKHASRLGVANGQAGSFVTEIHREQPHRLLPLLAELTVERLDFLNPVLWTYERCLRRMDDHEIFAADRGDEVPLVLTDGDKPG